jgi:peptide subunit release factor 1 (eRF1)
LTTLRDWPAGRGVLSVYLDTSPQRIAGQAHLLSLLAGCKALRARIPELDRPAFEAAVERVEHFLNTDFSPRQQGIAIFASADPAKLQVAVLPRSPIDKVTWGASPRIEPLQAMIDEFERVGVVLLDKERSRLFTISLGAIEEQKAFQDDVPGKQATGDWFALSQTRYARHHEEHVLRHVQRTATALMALLESHPFDRLIVGGPDEAVALLQESLPGPLRARLAGTLDIELFASDADVLKEAVQVAEAAERRTELAEINSLLEAASSRHVVLGVEPTLDALSDRRVHALFIADPFVGMGAECPACGLLVARGAQCPRCETPLIMVRDLRERIAERALDQKARVEMVSGEAGARLLARGGIGAWTRY